MGTKCVPACVTLVMAYLELQLYKKIERRFARNIRNEFEKDWGRYLDDCFINWDKYLPYARTTPHFEQPPSRNQVYYGIRPE